MAISLLFLFPLAGLLMVALGGAYLFLRVRRLERIEGEHFRYVDGRVDELAAVVYSRFADADQKFDMARRRLDIADDRLTRTEAAAHVDHLLQLTAAAAGRGEVPPGEAKALELQLLRWRDEALAAAPERDSAAAQSPTESDADAE
ncbi:MAG: hypothetical protein AAGM22_25050 [Acidobacteriota bacterium]